MEKNYESRIDPEIDKGDTYLYIYLPTFFSVGRDELFNKYSIYSWLPIEKEMKLKPHLVSCT